MGMLDSVCKSSSTRIGSADGVDVQAAIGQDHGVTAVA